MEGHINMLFSTVDTAQKCHIIGYGVCGKEDTTAHAYVTRQLQAEIVRLVEHRRNHKCGI